MSSPIRVAVVGVGYFGRFHARHYAAHPDAELVAVVNIDGARAEAVAAEFGGVPLTDFRDILDKVDAVSVAVPTSVHFPVVRDCLEAGLHVLVEKPITPDLASADQLCRIADANDLILQVGHIERHSATFATLKQAVSNPTLIEAHRLSTWTPRANDVDVVLDLMIHDIDMVLDLVRAPVTFVDAVGLSVVTPIDDVVNARLGFANGVTVNLTASRIAPEVERRMVVYEPDCVTLCDFARNEVLETRPVSASDHDAAPVNVSRRQIEPADSLGNQIAEFVAAVSGHALPKVDGRAGRAALHAAHLIIEATRSRRDAQTGAKPDMEYREGASIAESC